MAVGFSALVKKGVGFIDKVTFWELEHPFAVSVNVYTTFTAVTELLAIVSLILLPVPGKLPFGLVRLVLGITGLAHVKLVPVVALDPI